MMMLGLLTSAATVLVHRRTRTSAEREKAISRPWGGLLSICLEASVGLGFTIECSESRTGCSIDSMTQLTRLRRIAYRRAERNQLILSTCWHVADMAVPRRRHTSIMAQGNGSQKRSKGGWSGARYEAGGQRGMTAHLVCNFSVVETTSSGNGLFYPSVPDSVSRVSDELAIWHIDSRHPPSDESGLGLTFPFGPFRDNNRHRIFTLLPTLRIHAYGK
jgi:hypothetical protein